MRPSDYTTDSFDFADDIDVQQLRDDITAGQPWHDEGVLRGLYWDHELSQPEIAEGFDIHQSTVSKWMDRHDIETRYGGVRRRRKDDERVQYLAADGDGGQDTVYQYQLVALLEFEASEVFDPSTHIHHEMHLPVPVDVPANLTVVGDAEHSRLHGGEYDPEREAVLRAMRQDWPSEASEGDTTVAMTDGGRAED